MSIPIGLVIELDDVAVAVGSFTDWKSYTTKAYGLVYYVTFNGSAYRKLDMSSDLDVAFLFTFNGPNTPSLGYAVFDSNLLADFDTALDCGIIRYSNFAPVKRNDLNLEQSVINDDVQAISRNESSCKKFTHYKVYRSTVTSTGVGIVKHNCDLKSRAYKGPCTGDIDLRFSSLLSTSHTSACGTSWLKFFTDEGAIVGVICFITLFFAIFVQ